MIGGLVNHIISQAQIKGITNQRSEHALEYGPFHRDHALLPQELGENQVRIGQGQNLSWLPLQDLFHENPCNPLMHLHPLLPLVLGIDAEEGVVRCKNRFGAVNYCPDGFNGPELKEQVELVDGIWELFSATDQEGTEEISKFFI